MLASHGDRFELTSEVVDVKEEAREVLGVIPDYQLDTILAVCGYNPEDFAEDALGTVMKIRNIYESLKAIKMQIFKLYPPSEKPRWRCFYVRGRLKSAVILQITD